MNKFVLSLLFLCGIASAEAQTSLDQQSRVLLRRHRLEMKQAQQNGNEGEAAENAESDSRRLHARHRAPERRSHRRFSDGSGSESAAQPPRFLLCGNASGKSGKNRRTFRREKTPTRTPRAAKTEKSTRCHRRGQNPPRHRLAPSLHRQGRHLRCSRCRSGSEPPQLQKRRRYPSRQHACLHEGKQECHLA